MIVPQSSMTGKTKEEQSLKENILKHHTLEGVISEIKTHFMVLAQFLVLRDLLPGAAPCR